MSELERVDAAIARWFGDQSEPALRAVVALGEAAYRRVIGLFYGTERAPAVTGAQQGQPGRLLLDGWNVLLAAVAQAQPDLYLADLAAGRVRVLSSPYTEVGILGGIDRPAALDALLRYRDDPDWLVRHHAVIGLGRHTDPAAADALEPALTDEVKLNRDEAARALQRRDPADARARYERLLAGDALTAELRKELHRRVATAKRLARTARR